jgi:predicted GNAT superfamily acetyltransferase
MNSLKIPKTVEEYSTMQICKATDEYIPAVTSLADRVALSHLSEEERQRGFLRPYTQSKYQDFARHAEHFYVLLLDKLLSGFVLAHSSDKIDLFGQEVYLRMKEIQELPFIVVRQICIAPEISNKGYGRKLYDFLFKRAEEDIPKYRAAVNFIWKTPPNPASEKFHTALGWKELETYTLKNGTGVVGIWAHAINTTGNHRVI